MRSTDTPRLLQEHYGARLSDRDLSLEAEASPGTYIGPCDPVRHVLLCFSLDVLAVLLTDVLLLLQEKDQKYVFASVVGVLSSSDEGSRPP